MAGLIIVGVKALGIMARAAQDNTDSLSTFGEWLAEKGAELGASKGAGAEKGATRILTQF
jgi:hypothetical protein